MKTQNLVAVEHEFDLIDPVDRLRFLDMGGFIRSMEVALDYPPRVTKISIEILMDERRLSKLGKFKNATHGRVVIPTTSRSLYRMAEFYDGKTVRVTPKRDVEKLVVDLSSVYDVMNNLADLASFCSITGVVLSSARFAFTLNIPPYKVNADGLFISMANPDDNI